MIDQPNAPVTPKILTKDMLAAAIQDAEDCSYNGVTFSFQPSILLRKLNQQLAPVFSNAIASAQSECEKRLCEALDELNDIGGSFYCRYIDKLKTAPCLGADALIKAGEFTSENLEAHQEAFRHYGTHLGYMAATEKLRAALAEKG